MPDFPSSDPICDDICKDIKENIFTRITNPLTIENIVSDVQSALNMSPILLTLFNNITNLAAIVGTFNTFAAKTLSMLGSTLSNLQNQQLLLFNSMELQSILQDSPRDLKENMQTLDHFLRTQLHKFINQSCQHYNLPINNAITGLFCREIAKNLAADDFILKGKVQLLSARIDFLPSKQRLITANVALEQHAIYLPQPQESLAQQHQFWPSYPPPATQQVAPAKNDKMAIDFLLN